jgi:hypothetical protein
MLPIAARFARAATEEHARSALPTAPIRSVSPASAPVRAATSPRRRLATVLRRAADRLEPLTE